MKLLIATTNHGKIREFRDMLGASRYEWMDLTGIDVPEPAETGSTFRANACLKAEYYAKALNIWALADDSGLEVDALDGKPGVHSARWAELNGTGKGDRDNNALLLRQLDTVPSERRAARFTCVLALANPLGQTVLTARDSVEGCIIESPRGTNGFGYDPLFLVTALNQTTAELAPEQKHQISHRGKALKAMKGLMEQKVSLIVGG